MPLTIYKASAGSGKTYTLTRDFILLSLKGHNEQVWSKILAVTFTNKAAAEMKERLIIQLDNIINEKDKPLIESLANELNISDNEVKKRAKKILNEIIYNYGSLSVFTIDSFLQKVFKAFLFDLDINYSYDLVLNTYDVINSSVAEFIKGLEKESKVFGDLIKYVEYSIENADKFNVLPNITSLGLELVKENFYLNSNNLFEKLKEEGLMDGIIKEILSQRKLYVAEMDDLMEQARNIINKYSFDTNYFSGKSQSLVGWVNKMENKSFDFKIPYINKNLKYYDEDSWLSNSSISSEFDSELKPIFIAILDNYLNKNIIITSFNIVLSDLYVVNLLGKIDESLKAYLINNGYFLLADVPKVLADVIKSGGAGYVYEKTGNKYEHYIIDEFQDTSRLQWNNFVPLIENSLAENKNCLIAGDVKQAIYRWRNGDWTILAGGITSDINEELLLKKNLDNNWRSYPEIIKFNNNFFESATNIIQTYYFADIDIDDKCPQAETIYFEHKQHTPDKDYLDNGLIHANVYNTDNISNFREMVINELPDKILKLWTSGCKDIAVLVRDNSDIRIILDRLIESGAVYPIVTEQSFRLDTCPAVRFIIALMKAIANNDDKLIVNEACYLWKLINENEFGKKIDFSFHNNNDFSTFNLSDDNFNELLALKSTDPYSIAMRIISMFDLGRVDKWQSFLAAFLDAIMQYMSLGTALVPDFIRWYNENVDKLQVLAENLNEAVKIMTIHKSKGLQFAAVIIPFPLWKFEPKHGGLLWLKNNTAPLDKLPVLPVKIAKNLSESVFKDDYNTEKLKSVIDNLNLLYVAFTRAEAYLDISYFEKTVSSGYYAYHLLTNVIKTLHPDEIINEETKNIYSFGKAVAKYPKHKIEERKIIPFDYAAEIMNYKMIVDTREHVMLFSDIGYAVNYGNKIHSVLEKVIYKADLNSALQTCKQQGIILNNEVDEMRLHFEKLFSIPQISDWFSNNWDVFNEKVIIAENGMQYRPDRVLIKDNKAVVIDYKTGTTEISVYEKQIKNYALLLSEMGYTNIEGWILKPDEFIAEKIV